jgi:AbrB family looped-hinge helix DNA binding protein
MYTVKLSRRHQVTVPQPVRDALSLEPGQDLSLFERGGRIVMVPVPSLAQARGFLRGIDTGVARVHDRV